MQISANQLSPVLLELSIEVDAERVTEELDKAYKQLSRGATVRGFRRGKAPRKVLRHVYGARIAADVAQRLVDETYSQAVDQQKVQTVSRPNIESRALSENEPFSYKARVEILPKIETVEYAGFEVKRPSTAVADEQIAEQLEQLRRANSTLEPAADDHAAEVGDVATVDFKVSVAGREVEDAQTEGLDIELGQNSVLPEIEAAVMGQKVAFEGNVEVQMPEAVGHPKLSGKKAVFSIVLKELKTRVLPELDDEFAKDLGDFDDLDGLKKSISEQLEAQAGDAADNAVAKALVAELVRRNPIQVPPTLVQQQMRITEQELIRQAGRQRELPPEVRQRVQEDSEIKVRAGLLMAEIAKSKGIQVSAEDLEEGLKSLAEQTGKNVARLKAEYQSKQKREMLVGMILENKVLDIIEQEAKIEQE